MRPGIAKARQWFAHSVRGLAVSIGHTLAQAEGELSPCGDDARAVMVQPQVAAKFTLTRANCGVRQAGAMERQQEEKALSLPVGMARQMDLYGMTSVTTGQVNDAPLIQGVSGSVGRASLRRGSAAPRVAKAGADARRVLALVPVMDAAARKHDIDPLLLHAIARVESRHNVKAISHAGARGVMQVMPMTGRRFGVGHTESLHDAATNVDVSATYLKVLQRRFGNDLVLILAAYNAGEGAVERHGRRVPPYRETRAYVRSVLGEYDRLRRAVAASRPGSGDLS